MGIDGSQINYEERIVAFIDILGFKQIIAESENDLDKLKSINKVLQYLKNHENTSLWDSSLMEIEEDAQKRGMDKFDITGLISCTCFSDSIVISIPTHGGSVNEIVSSLIGKLSSIGGQLMTEGILIRGGITIGSLIHSNSGVVMGPALIEAYELEVKVSKQARIVFSNKLLAKLNYPITEKSKRYPYHQYLVRFNDGCVGFHQMIIFQVLQNSSEMSDKDLKANLDKVRKVIIAGLDASFELPDVYLKYAWLVDAYNGLYILEKGMKSPIMKLNEKIAGHNIHFSYTDDFYHNRKNS